MILSSTRSANHARVESAGDSAGQLLNRVFERHRILDEARHTADPVHLMRVFGISDTTAMKYVYAAHPERRSTLPR